MELKVDPRLSALCQRDEVIAVRDDAKRAVERGDREAGFVLAWMDQLLQARSSAAKPITTPAATMIGQRFR